MEDKPTRPLVPDIVIVSDEEMLAWCEMEGLTPPEMDADGFRNWPAFYLEWLGDWRKEREEKP